MIMTSQEAARRGALSKGKPKTLTAEQRAQRGDQSRARLLARYAARKPSKWIMSYSGGKDSTAMLHVILREKLPLDEIITFASDWEFPGLEKHLQEVEAREHVTITRIRPSVPWFELLNRWGWPHWNKRWCTGDKGVCLDKATRGCAKYIGIAADEAHRAQKYRDGKTQVRLASFPLIDAGITTAQAMRMCRDMGYTWTAEGETVGLYDRFSRFSCFCCPLQSARSLATVRQHYPDLWRQITEAHAALPYRWRDEGFKAGRTPDQQANVRGRCGRCRAYAVGEYAQSTMELDTL